MPASVHPSIRRQFDSMPAHLQEAVLAQNRPLNTMADLMACLERIIDGGEPHA